MRLFSVEYAALPAEGEDSCTLRSDERGALLCVADGCGGLGSRRYESLGNHTGAFVASRLVTRAVSGWASERMPMPKNKQDGEILKRELESDLDGILKGFGDKHCAAENTRIVGSMQRRLPTTLCAALSEEGGATWRDVCFFWAGDSRGYVLDINGLHQCTRDHLHGDADPFDSLYCDGPLGRFLSADQPAQLSMRRLRATLPCIILVATDGAFGCLRTPMEFEMLLLNTLHTAKSWESWQRKLQNELAKLAHDDATLLWQPCGFDDFSALKQTFAPRRELLQKHFITPVRRKRRDADFARVKWLAYRSTYDWTEGERDERADWRI